MATITAFTATRSQAIEDGTVVSGMIVSGHLILTKHDGSTIDAGPVTGDVTVVLASLMAGDQIVWAGDTNLYRVGANHLKTDDAFTAAGALDSQTSVAVQLAAETQARIKMGSTGILFSDGTAAADTNIYRSAANVLKTDDSLIVDADLTVNGIAAVHHATDDGTKLYRVNLGSETYPRFGIFTDGGLGWGPGSGDIDTVLYRNGLASLRTDNDFFIGGGLGIVGFTDANSLRATVASAGTDALGTSVTGDSGSYRFYIQGDGKQQWGAGAGSYDTDFYRSAAGVLKTSGRMEVASFKIGGYFIGLGGQDANRCTVGDVASSTSTTEVAIPSASWASEPTYSFAPGDLYELTLIFYAYTNAATESATRVRIRSGAQTTSGGVLGTFPVPLPAILGSLGLAAGFVFTCYVTNTGGSPVTTKLSVTNQRVSGASTTKLYGDGTIPIRLFVKHIGSATGNSGLSAVSV